MAKSLTYQYAEIVKVDKNADGTATAYGIATDSSLDSDKQRCEATWLKTAMPEWFEYGNIREQHSSIAAGKATELEEKEGRYFIKADIVDAGSVLKLERKIFSGFSVGIRDARIVKDASAPGGLIVGGQIVEVSLVDRPANPNARLILAKSVDGVLTKTEEEEEVVVEPDEVTEPEVKVEPETEPELEPELEVETKPEVETEPEKEVVEEVVEGTVEEVVEVPEEKEVSLDDLSVEAIIERAVKAARESVREQVELLKTANEAGIEELNKMREALVDANSKAASGGPKRSAMGATKDNSASMFASKAAEYRAKAASTSDSILAKGWKEIAQDFETKALEATVTK